MRPAREIFEMRDKGLYPCQAKGCKKYGNVVSKSFAAVVCSDHASH